MTLYQIIKSLQETQGTNAKLKILEENKDNVLLQKYLKAVYDPRINYYISKPPKFSTALSSFGSEMDEKEISLLENLSERKITGNAAKQFLAERLSEVSTEAQELYSYIIRRDIRASIGHSLILRIWPDLFFIPPYQRCSTLNDKTAKRFSEFKEFIIQPKLDGSYGSLIVHSENELELLTRSGNSYPKWFPRRLIGTVSPKSIGNVFIGEIEVFEDGVLLPRKTGNGILNSIQQGEPEEEFSKYEFKQTCWDCVPLNAFYAAKWNVKYLSRYAFLRENIQDTNLSIIESSIVSSMEQAMEIYRRTTMSGMEGCIIKNVDSLWKDGTANDLVKLKIAFSCDYEIIDFYEGDGKYKGMLGGFTIATSDRLLISNVGSGFDDKQREAFWKDPSSLIGKIVEVEANEIISSKGRTETVSLSLPIFIEIRADKTKADSLSRVEEQLEAAKRGE